MLWNVRASGQKCATARVLRSIKKWIFIKLNLNVIFIQILKEKLHLSGHYVFSIKFEAFFFTNKNIPHPPKVNDKIQIIRFYLSLVRSVVYGESEVKLFACKEITNRWSFSFSKGEKWYDKLLNVFPNTFDRWLFFLYISCKKQYWLSATSNLFLLYLKVLTLKSKKCL
jgi:hypothetical protein